MRGDLFSPPFRRDRVMAAAAVAIIEAALLTLLLTGFPARSPAPPETGPAVFTITPPPPPARPPARPVRPRTRSAGAAAPPNLKSRRTAIVAPPPAIPLLVPPIVIAAPIAGAGADPTAGNASVRGPGAGGGGIGNGTGGGGTGEGDGDGETPPRWRSGRLHNSDFPRAAFEAGAQGTVSVRYTVTVAGRATDCSVTRSSGSAILDATTCRLIEKRMRFYPSLDGAGRPVEAVIEEDHSWVLEQDAAPKPAAGEEEGFSPASPPARRSAPG